MRSLVIHALVWGTGFSVALSVCLVVVLRINAEIMLNDYPPDIRAAWGPMTRRTKRQRWLAAATLLLVALAFVAGSLVTLPEFAARRLPFTSGFVYFGIMFGTFNVFDWLVLDCALVYLQPRFAILPGTEGLAGYQNYWFHFRGFLVGIPLVLLAARSPLRSCRLRSRTGEDMIMPRAARSRSDHSLHRRFLDCHHCPAPPNDRCN